MKALEVLMVVLHDCLELNPVVIIMIVKHNVEILDEQVSADSKHKMILNSTQILICHYSEGNQIDIS